MKTMNKHAVALEADIIKREADAVARAADDVEKLNEEALAFLQSRGVKA